MRTRSHTTSPIMRNTLRWVSDRFGVALTGVCMHAVWISSFDQRKFSTFLITHIIYRCRRALRGNWKQRTLLLFYTNWVRFGRFPPVFTPFRTVVASSVESERAALAYCRPLFALLGLWLAFLAYPKRNSSVWVGFLFPVLFLRGKMRAVDEDFQKLSFCTHSPTNRCYYRRAFARDLIFILPPKDFLGECVAQTGKNVLMHTFLTHEFGEFRVSQ